MESWLTFDTIRRAGYGHVLINGRHVLTIERGVSFVALDAKGRPLLQVYEANLFGPQERHILRARP
jgi:hypothetical protein